MKTLKELNDHIEVNRKKIADMFETAGPELNMTAGDADEVKRLNTELTELSKERDQRLEMDNIRKNVNEEERRQFEAKNNIRLPDVSKAVENEISSKSLGDMFVESAAYKEYSRAHHRGPVVELPIGNMIAGAGVKTNLETSDWPFVADRRPGFVSYPFSRLVVADLIPQAGTTSSSISYVEEQAPTNAAAFVAEAGTKPESALTFQEKLASVGKIATIIPVTDEMLSDLPQIRGYVDQRLRTFIALKEEDALLNGTGIAPEFNGLLTVANILTQAVGTDTPADAVYKAMVKIQTTAFLDPSALIMNPLDWQTIALLKTADGAYVWGGPQDGGPERIWGMPVVKTAAIAQGTAVTAAFDTAMQIFRRQEISIAVSDSHDVYFAKNLLAIRAEERLGFVVYRPAAVCKITGL